MSENDWTSSTRKNGLLQCRLTDGGTTLHIRALLADGRRFDAEPFTLEHAPFVADLAQLKDSIVADFDIVVDAEQGYPILAKGAFHIQLSQAFEASIVREFRTLEMQFRQLAQHYRRSSVFVFDAADHHPSIAVSKNGKLMAKTSAPNIHSSCNVHPVVEPSHRHLFMFRMLTVASHYFMLGVSTGKPTAHTPYLGHVSRPNGVAYYCNNNHVYRNGKSAAYDGIMATGAPNIVGVEVDAGACRVRYYRNAQMGAWVSLPPTDSVYVVEANIYSVGDALEMATEHCIMDIPLNDP